MDALVIASGAITILKAAMQEVESQVKEGKISVDAQEALHRKIDLIRDGDFSGPEWAIVPDPVPSAPPPPPS